MNQKRELYAVNAKCKPSRLTIVCMKDRQRDSTFLLKKYFVNNVVILNRTPALLRPTHLLSFSLSMEMAWYHHILHTQILYTK